MKKFIIAAITLTSTLFGSGLQGNDSSEQVQKCYVKECYLQEDNSIDAVVYNYVERPCTDKGFYVGGLAGINFINHHGKAGFTGGLFGGFKFENNFRVEGELGYRYHSMHGVNLNTYSYMANGLYDLPKIFHVTPYVGLGIGYAHTTTNIHSHGCSVRIHDNDFVMQGIVGFSRKISNDLHLGLEYRIFGTKHDVYDHSVVVSVKRFI
ncbi:MAG: porin family protein [Parachlamydiaceae bacterium]|nr:porin family protein [Parachlamydiaceae bacterium]